MFENLIGNQRSVSQTKVWRWLSCLTLRDAVRAILVWLLQFILAMEPVIKPLQKKVVLEAWGLVPDSAKDRVARALIECRSLKAEGVEISANTTTLPGFMFSAREDQYTNASAPKMLRQP
ncbi:hypothetical protein NKI16_29110 [Mesorhizobium sp. M0698]